jgi:hypothetical protein
MQVLFGAESGDMRCAARWLVSMACTLSNCRRGRGPLARLARWLLHNFFKIPNVRGKTRSLGAGISS